jgi:subtilase family serine protease
MSLLAFAVASTGAAAQQLAPGAIVARHVAEGAQITRSSLGTIVTPKSSIRLPDGNGTQNYTNTKFLVPDTPIVPQNSPLANSPSANAPPASGYYFVNTPASLACVYKLVAVASGCHPDKFHTNAAGGSKAVGIVDAYDAPNVLADLKHYSTQFGLPAPKLTVYYCTGSTPATCATNGTHPAYDSGWEGETSLDVQMVHALAPSAKIFLVLAKDSSSSNLYAAVQKAAQLVNGAGGGEVSMSFGHHEVSNDVSNFDSIFKKGKVVFFASSGDDPAVSYPATSTKVVSVGGTSISRNPANGNFIGEASWAEAGSGPSAYIARPSWQPASVGSKRGNPDVSAVANPDTGVWVYISGQGGWYIFGGTSAASPLMAAIVNNAGTFSANNTAQEKLMYGAMGKAAQWYDVKNGYCGPSAGYWPDTGYDFCGGIGSPRGKNGK